MFNAIAPRIAALEISAAFGSDVLPGMKAVVQGDMPLLDTEVASGNGVATARALARMYGAIANGGEIDGNRYLSAGVVRPDRPAEPSRSTGVWAFRCRFTWATTRFQSPSSCRDWPRRARRLLRLGDSRGGPGIRIGAQQVADPVRRHRSGGFPRDGGSGATGRRSRHVGAVSSRSRSSARATLWLLPEWFAG